MGQLKLRPTISNPLASVSSCFSFAQSSVISAHFISLLFLISRSQRKCISYTQLELDLLYSLCDIPFSLILLSVLFGIVISLTECSCFPFSKHVYFLVWFSFEEPRSGAAVAKRKHLPSPPRQRRCPRGMTTMHAISRYHSRRGTLRLRGLFRAYYENMIFSYCGRFGHV